MSLNLAVWDGPRPNNGEAALAEYQTLYDKWFGEDSDPEIDDELTPAIRGYVQALLDRWPDITEDAGEDSPWSDGPLIDNAAGNFFYFGVTWGMAEEAAAVCSQVANERGLVCFDPGSSTLL